MYMHIAEYYRPSRQYLAGPALHAELYYKRKYFGYYLAVLTLAKGWRH